MPTVIGFSAPVPPKPEGASFPAEGEPMPRPTNPLYFRLSYRKFEAAMSSIPDHRKQMMFRQNSN